MCFTLQGLNARLVFAITAAALGSGFQHGYNTGVVNAPQELIMAWIQRCNETEPDAADASDGLTVSDNSTSADVNCEMTEERVTIIWSWIVAIFCIGGMIGGSAVGLVSGKLGRFVRRGL